MVQTEIYLDVLKTIEKGTYEPTKTMYSNNLCWNPLIRILDSLERQGLATVEKEGKHKIYEIEEKGENILEHFSEAMESIEITWVTRWLMYSAFRLSSLVGK